MSRGAFVLVFACCLACDSDPSDTDDAVRPDAGGAGPGRDAAAGDSGSKGAQAGGAGASEADAGSADASSAPAADGGGDAAASDAGGVIEPVRVQVFSRTAGFRHDSIEPAQEALSTIAARRGAVLDRTEDPAQLIARLGATDVVVFLMTTGDVLDAAQQQQFESYVRAGGGFVGVHSSADTEYDWPFYRELNGAWFADHPATQPATILVDAADDPLVSFLPSAWLRTDEWYNFRENPRGRVKVLLRLDESTYTGGSMGADHPIAWTRTVDRGRAFYTGLGHTPESWAESMLLRHVEAGLFWAAGR